MNDVRYNLQYLLDVLSVIDIDNLSWKFADFYTLFDSPYEKDVPDYAFTDHVHYTYL